MQKDIDNAVILPADYDENKMYPVIYLLHGYGDSYFDWYSRTKQTLQEEASKYGFIIVCPSGEKSWYWDSTLHPEIRYETYISKEVVAYIDENFSTVKSPKGRAITGNSMGGQGALWLAIRHSDIFGACGSMSGGVDLRPFEPHWNLVEMLGIQEENGATWEKHAIINELHQYKPDSLSIIIDCGYKDFFYQVNEELHAEMLRLNIDHDYYTRPGEHRHEYWENAIDYQLLFFSKYFDRNKDSFLSEADIKR